MPSRRDLFLRAVLGPDGAKALGTVAKSSSDVAAVLAPRAALAWLSTRAHYEGAIPGVEGSYLRLEKAESGFTGQVTLGDGLHTFESAPPEHVTAAVVMALGDAFVPRKAGRDIDLARLGRTVDLLVKARRLQKAQPSGPQKGTAGAPLEPAKPEPKEDFVEDESPKLPGMKQKVPPTKTPTTATPTPTPTTTTLKLSERETSTSCSVCASTQMKAGKFTGCFCLRDLAKSVIALPTPTGVTLTLGSGWDSDAVLTLLEAVGRK